MIVAQCFPLLHLYSHEQSDSICKIIKDNRVRHLPVNKDEYSRIVVRRKHLWGDAMNHLKNINENKYKS